jgi:hypothetical protein
MGLFVQEYYPLIENLTRPHPAASFQRRAVIAFRFGLHKVPDRSQEYPQLVKTGNQNSR